MIILVWSSGLFIIISTKVWQPHLSTEKSQEDEMISCLYGCHDTSLIKWFVELSDFSIKRQKIRDNDQAARGLKKRGAKRQQSTGIYLSSCGAVEKRETNKCSIKKQETTTTGLVIPDHSLMSRQLLDNHPGKKIVDDHPPCGAPSVYVPARWNLNFLIMNCLIPNFVDELF